MKYLEKKSQRLLLVPDTDIQLKTLRRSLEVFNMKINMRRDYVIFQIENHIISNAKGGAFQFKLK